MAEPVKGRPSDAPADAPAGESQETFLGRWSRLKQETRQAPPQEALEMAKGAGTPAPDLPPADKLTIDSDFRPFFHPKVDEDVRRAALKKLFSDPRFNVMDGLDVYIDDYSKTEPIPPEMLAGLRQAQKILEWAKGAKEEGEEGQPARIAAAGTEALEPPSSPGALESAPPSAALDTPPGTPAEAGGAAKS